MEKQAISKKEIVRLESKSWYRLLRTIYIGGYVFAGAAVLLIALVDTASGKWGWAFSIAVIGGLCVFLFFDFLKRMFSYVVIHGNFFTSWGKSLLIIFLFLIAGGLAFNFDFQQQNQKLLDQFNTEQTSEQQQCAEQRAQQQQALEQKDTAAVNVCLSKADAAYQAALQQACVTLSKDIERDYNNCSVTAGSDYCRNLYPEIPNNCGLQQIADDAGDLIESVPAGEMLRTVNAGYQQDKSKCNALAYGAPLTAAQIAAYSSPSSTQPLTAAEQICVNEWLRSIGAQVPTEVAPQANWWSVLGDMFGDFGSSIRGALDMLEPTSATKTPQNTESFHLNF